MNRNRCPNCPGVRTWNTKNFAERFQSGDLLTLTFSFSGATAVAIIASVTKDVRWKFQFWSIELPLFLALAFIILGKMWAFQQSSDTFNHYVTQLPYYPEGQPFEYEVTAVRIRTELRAAFWTGTMTGLIGVQLIVAQIASLGLDIAVRKCKKQ